MTRDFEQFPDDDNGNVLWQMAEDGNDLSLPYEVEYSIIFAEQQQAEQCALFLLHQEQKVSLYEEEEGESRYWVVSAYIELIPMHEDITDLEQWFIRIADKFAGEYDGWGCIAYDYDQDDAEDDLLDNDLLYHDMQNAKN